MKKSFLLLIVALWSFSFTAFATESLVLSGIYQGKDLYVKNPFAEDGVGFCVFEVSVNGEITSDEINSSAFAIDFNIMGIEVGSKIDIVLKHKEDCEPLVLNPEAIKPHSTFKLKKIGVDGNVISWTTEGESGSLPFVIEQFRWNKWVKAGEVFGEGTADEHKYKFELTPYSGENKVRVRQTDYTGKPRYTEHVIYQPQVRKVEFEPKKASDDITFTAPTRFEIFDKYGSLVKTGYGKSVNVSNLQKGEDYYLNYDSSFGETFKKK
ncbi:MAG: hypothetical protein ABR572_02235 [Cryomorphaceae bacterium]|nr:hypothetical protein [Flavobacteriales bacterium]